MMIFKTSLLLVCTFILMITLNIFSSAWYPENISNAEETLKDVSKNVKSLSGWSEDVRLTYTPDPLDWDKENSTGSDRIAVGGNTIHVVYDMGCVNYTEIQPGIWAWAVTLLDIYYIRSEDMGKTWTNPMRLTHDEFDPGPDPVTCYNGSGLPKIAVWGDNVHLIYQRQMSSGDAVIIYRNSTDKGITWSEEKMLTPDDDYSSESSYIAVNGSTIHVVWTERINLYPYWAEVFYIRSLDDGVTWDDGQGNIDQPRQISFPLPNADWGLDVSGIAVSGSNIHVVGAQSLRFEEGEEKWSEWCSMYLNSTDNGETWSNTTIISKIDKRSSMHPSIAAQGPNVHAVWKDGEYSPTSSGGGTIVYRSSTDNGVTWNPRARLTNGTDRSEQPTITVDNDKVLVAYIDNRDHYPYEDAFEIYYINSGDGGGTWGSETRLTYAKNCSANPDIITADGYIHLVFLDNRTGDDHDGEIYYKRYPDFASNISLTANPSILPPDGISTSVITATVTNKTGSPIQGLNVCFSINSGSGVLLSSYNYTDSTGKTSVTYQAGTISGDVVINATVDGIWNITTITLTPEGPANISLTTSSSVLTADASSTSLITATVINETGNPVEGINMNFTIESGCGSLSANSNITDANGNTTIVYTAGTTTGDVVIKASANGLSNTTTITLVAGNPTHISVSANPNTIIADGISTSTITVIVTDMYGNPVPNTIVYFMNETGIGSINPTSNTTNPSGVTSAVYTAGTILGNEIINVTCGYICNATMIYLVSGSVTEILIYPIESTNLHVGDTQQFTAIGYDKSGNLNTSWSPLWRIDGNIGIINNQGFFTATGKGIGAVNCTDNVTGVCNASVINVLNSKPVLETIGNQTAYGGQMFLLQINAYDPDNDTIMFSDNSTLFNINSTTGLILFTPSYNSAGIYLINIAVSDGIDTARQIFKLTIININRAPVAVITSPAQNAKFSTNDNLFFDAAASSDPDNDNLTYTWTSSVDGTIGSNASFNKKLSKGTHTITLTVNDGNGGIDTKQITITVKKPSEPSGGFIPGFEPVSLLAFVCGLAVIIILLRKRKI